MAENAPDLSEAIATNAAAPQQVTVDGVTARGQSVQDQIAADKYLASKAAARRKGLPIRFFKIVPPGSADLPPTP
jgi:hypothetical protein